MSGGGGVNPIVQTREQCEQFQMIQFGISCATCERSDDECPWHRQDDREYEIRPEEIMLLAT